MVAAAQYYDINLLGSAQNSSQRLNEPSLRSLFIPMLFSEEVEKQTTWRHPAR
jgi:hypothetical protein